MAAENEIGKALKTVLSRMEAACARRSTDLPSLSPRLVAVSKTKHIDMIQQAYQHTQRNFGENYIQELVMKSKDLTMQSTCPDIRWHFIGHIQSNKVKKLLETQNLFMVETVDTTKIARELDKHWKLEDQRLKVMVQVNTSGEESKAGITPDKCSDLVEYVLKECQNLTFTGLMTIGSLNHDYSQGPNPDFQALLKCRSDVCQTLSLCHADVELSMGMSGDFEHAIEVGSSNIRVGSTIFGARSKGKSKPADESVDQQMANMKVSDS